MYQIKYFGLIQGVKLLKLNKHMPKQKRQPGIEPLKKWQIKEIAEMWAAGLLIQCGDDSFSESDCISDKDVEKILYEINVIAIKLAKGRKQNYTLSGIIQQTLKPIEDIISDSRDQPTPAT